MAKRQHRTKSRLERTAESAGRSLGRAARVVDSLKARHPDPIGEVAEALRTGRERVSQMAADAQRRSAAVAKETKAAVRRARSSAARARRKTAKALSGVRRSTKKTLRRAKSIVNRARPTASRRTKAKR